MSRLPIPGQDDDVWGEILNDFLEVSNNNDGSLQTSAITKAGGYVKPSNGIPLSDLDGSIQSIIDSVASKYSFPSGGIPSTDMSSAVQVSLSFALSSVQLGGDIGGTTTSPIVTKLQGTFVNAASPTNNQVLSYSGGEWVPATVSSTTVNDATSSVPGLIQLDGDLGNTATDPQVVSTHLASALPVNQGGTGSETQNFVDLSTNQASIGGNKTFTGTLTANNTIEGNISGNAATATTSSTVTTNADLTGDVTSVGNATTLTSSSNVESIISNNSTVTSKASLVSPAFTGTPTAPTATSGTNTTQIATTAFVESAVTNGSAQDANSSTPGLIQLDGDLGGTATSPEVVSTHLASALPINQGGTGSETQNFVDLTSNQTKTGVLTAPLEDMGGQVYNVKAYGATGNGGTDDTAAINSAIAAANTAGAGQVFFPGGTYIVSGTLGAPATGITLAGNSLSSVIQLSTSFSGSSVIPLNNVNTGVVNLRFIGGPSTTTSSNPATNFIEITGASGCLVDNIYATYINGYIVEAVGTASSGPTKLVINNIRGQYNAYGIHTLGNGSSNHNMQASIMNVNLQEVTLGDLILVEDSNDVQITNVNGSIYGSSSSNASALRIHGACASVFAVSLDVGVYPNKPAATPTVLIETGANGSPSDIQLIGGIIQDGLIGLSITGGSKMIVSGMRIQGNGLYGLSITGSVSDIQINNVIFNINGQTAGPANYDAYIDSTGGGININRCDFSTPQGTSAGEVSNVGFNIASNTAVWQSCNFLGTGFTIANVFSGNPSIGLFNRLPSAPIPSINLPNTAFTSSTQLGVYTGAPSNLGIVVQGAPSQTGDLFRVSDSNNTTLASFDKNGNLTASSIAVSGVSSITTNATGAGLTVTDSTNGGQYLAELDSTHYLSLRKKSTAGSEIQAVEASGTSTLDLDAIPSDGVSQSIVRVARNTTTSSTGSGFYIYKGDGTATVQSFFGNQTSYLNAISGNVAIGKSSAGTMLDVNGKVTMTGFNLSTSPTNGYVLTSDGGGNGSWQVVPSVDVTAGDTSIVVGGTASAPTIETNTLDVIATDHPAAANWSNNSKKITNLANGTVATDAAAFGQTPAGGAIVSGQYVCTPMSYAPGSQTALTTTSGTMAAMSSASVNTGSFTAPASGNVVINVSFVAEVSASSTVCAIGLCAHGTITPMVGNVIVLKIPSANEPLPYQLTFLVTGLTSGATYNFDLMFATNTGTLTVQAFGITSTTPTGGGTGAPILMTVQAV